MLVQEFYNITCDMPTDEMLSVAAENHETMMSLIEEQHRASLIKPLHIWITRWVGLEKFKVLIFAKCVIFLSILSALSPTCHFLISNLLSTEVFPHVSAISLHLLDLEGDEEELQGLKIETEDLALPLLHQV